MGITTKLDSISISLNKKVRSLLVTYSEYMNLYKKRSLIKKVRLTKQQKGEINEFFKRYYGKAVPCYWHRLYQSYTGVYKKDYFPEILLSTKLEPFWNPYREAELLGDKNLLPSLFSEIELLRVPKTYASCVKGRCRNMEQEFISFKAMNNMLFNIGSCVIKRTIGTSSGRDVQVCNIMNGIDKKSGLSLKAILKSFGENYVVQELIVQHESLEKLNPTSINTFRIITYYCDSIVYTCPIALRIGRLCSDKDNIHYGGICVGVNEEGELKPKAFSEYGEYFFDHPDSHVRFHGLRVGGVNLKEIVNSVRKAHGRIPHLGLLSWDIAIDNAGTGVVIEINTTGQSAWFCQMVNGESLFGENTPKILDILNNSK